MNPYPVQAPGCLACGRGVPTKNVTLWQNIGVIVMRFHKRIEGNLCRECIDKYFWQYQMTTFFLGWWGVISFFFTLYILPANLMVYLNSRSLPKTP
jgi:hypothetical protein